MRPTFPSPIACTTFCVASSHFLRTNFYHIDMAPSYLRLVPADIRNLISFDPNKSVLLLLKVANLSNDFEEDLGKGTAFTPTLSSPQPQAGAMAGSLANALLTSPQETTLNFNTLPANLLAAPIGVTQRSFSSSPPLFKHCTHLEIGAFNAATPSFNFTGLFSFMAIPNFETLFNILVIFSLLYLLFTPLVSGLLWSPLPLTLQQPSGWR